MNPIRKALVPLLMLLAIASSAFAQKATIIQLPSDPQTGKPGMLLGIVYLPSGPLILTEITLVKLDNPTPTPPNPSEGLAAQLIVLRDQMTATTKSVAVLLDLQEKYQKGTKPEMFLLDRTEPSTITTTFMKLKPASAAFPYFFLVDKGGKVLHHGPVLTTTEENVTLIQKYQEKQPP